MTQIRPAQAVNPWLTHTVRIAEITPECEGVTTYRLCLDDSHDPSIYEFQPGQFNMLYVPGVGESAMSISGDAHDRDAWIHTTRLVGNVTNSLAKLQPGQTLGLRGPFGTGWPIEQLRGHDVILVAGGLGLPPLRPLIYHILRHRSQFGFVSLIVGARTPVGLLYPSQYSEWASSGIDIQLTVDRPTTGWHGNLGVVTTLLDRIKLPAIDQTCVVTCGPEVMMKYAAMSAIRRGIRSDRIWVSMERNLQCAVGLCGHCQLGPAFICKDGPVFRYDRLQPYLFVESL